MDFAGWDLLLQSGIFGGLAGLIGSLWWRHVDQRRASWYLFNAMATWTATDGFSVTYPRIDCHLANSSEAPGLRVTAKGVGCHVAVRGDDERAAKLDAMPATWLEVIPCFTSGTDARLIIHCAIDAWDRAEIAILWREPSIWRGSQARKVMLIPVRDIAEAPEFSTTIVSGSLGLKSSSKRSLPLGLEQGTLPPDLKPQRPLERTHLAKYWQKLCLRRCA